MSTILKALRRLEREKAQADRPLREQVTSPGSPGRGDGGPPRRWPILLGGVGAGVLAGLAVLVLVFSRGESVEEVAPETGARAAAPAALPQPGRRERRARQAPPAAVPAQPPAAARAVEPPAPEPEPLEDVAVVERGTPEPRIVAEVPPAPSAASAAPKPGSLRPMNRPDHLPGRHLMPEAAEAPAGAPEVAAPVQAPAPPVEPDPVPEPALRPRAPTPVETPRAEPSPRAATAAREPAPPKRAAPKAASAAALPDLRVERTTWHPVAERRVAVIELPGGETQSVHEGERVAGVVVKRIEPSGVVFEQAGRELRRPIGAGP